MNTWPGDMITIDDTNALGMYHTFTFSSTTKYEELYVILNRVTEKGKIEETLQNGTNEDNNPVGFRVPTDTSEATISPDGTFLQSFFIVTESDGTKTGHWSKTSN